MTEFNTFVCTTCGQRYSLDTRDWRCGCGGLFELATRPPFDTAKLDGTQRGLWRYRSLLPLHPDWEPATLGEGNTPLIPIDWEGQPLWFKLESMAPTGSFKDRGTTVMVTALRGLGITRVVEDSSGNAGASLAAYAARAGMECEICVPDSAAGPKLAQMAHHGAEVIQIKGKREYAALAAWAAAAHGAYYASHVYNPYFLAGTETVAYELWEQLDCSAPALVVLPVGNGSLLLGVYRGFRQLQRAGLCTHLPRLIAVQAAACDPIYQAHHAERKTVEPVASRPTKAGGIAISQPARGAQVLTAVRATAGTVVSVSEESIERTRSQMARQGFYVEDTSAAAVAALPQLRDMLPVPGDKPVIVLLTGHGLKTQSEP